MTLIPLAIAWLLGIVAADLLRLPAPVLALTALLGVGLAAVSGRVPRLRLAALLLCCAALGGVRLDLAQVATTPHSLRLLNDRGDVTIEGLVVEDPKRTEDGQRVLLAADRALVNGRARSAEGLVLIKLPPYPGRRYGDRLRIGGMLTTPREAERPGQFDYRQYLARKRIFSLIEPKTVRLVSERNGSSAWNSLLSLRDRARRVLLRELPEPQASLAVGILLGLQSSIPADVTANFSATGTSHILVISGWNISIIAAALYSLAEGLRIPKRRAFWSILGTIWLYTLFKRWTQYNEGDHLRGAAGGAVIIAHPSSIVSRLALAQLNVAASEADTAKLPWEFLDDPGGKIMSI